MVVVATRLERESNQWNRENWEIGGDYEYEFSNGSKFRLLAIVNDENTDYVRERYDVSGATEDKNLFIPFQMRGMFQQDRELYASTHAASDDDGSGAGFSGVAGKSVGVGQAKEGPALNASQVKFLRNLHWGELREPALCV